MSERIVYLVQDVPGTKAGTPRINIVGAREYGEVKSLLPELSQIIFSPGPLIFKLRQGLKNFSEKDYLLLTGDPAIIGVACSMRWVLPFDPPPTHSGRRTCPVIDIVSPWKWRPLTAPCRRRRCAGCWWATPRACARSPAR